MLLDDLRPESGRATRPTRTGPPFTTGQFGLYYPRISGYGCRISALSQPPGT